LVTVSSYKQIHDLNNLYTAPVPTFTFSLLFFIISLSQRSIMTYRMATVGE